MPPLHEKGETIMNSTVQEEQKTYINTDLIEPWVADYLAEGLLRAVRNYFSVPENMAKFEKWKAERDAERKAQNEAASD